MDLAAGGTPKDGARPYHPKGRRGPMPKRYKSTRTFSNHVSAEQLFLEAFAQVAESRLFQLGRDVCYGCNHDCLSQRDHDKCTIGYGIDRYEMDVQYFPRLVDLVPRHDVSYNFYEKAARQGINLHEIVIFFGDFDPFMKRTFDPVWRMKVLDILFR
jgi:hypothetical protein